MKKKNTLVSLVLICVIFLGVVLVKNLQYEAEYLDYTELTREELLRKMPEAVVNETDLAIQEALLNIPDIQKAAEISYSLAFSADAAEELLGGLLPQDAEIVDVSGGGAFLYLTYEQGTVQTTYQFTLDGSAEPYKLTKVSSRTWYEDLPDGTYRENTMKRDWFYFLKG